MKRYINLFIPVALLLVFILGSFSFNDWLETILARLDNYRVTYPQEKVHIHTDKPYYAIGDEMWLKAYVVNSENHELSVMSKVLYVDLLDERDSVCKTAVIQLANGLGNADINLSDSLFKAGNYTLRGYTRWMQNFSSDYFFYKKIMIGDARAGLYNAASVKLKQEDSLKTDVRFFPEGGWLVNGLRSRVGVKAMLNNGKGIAVNGIVVNSSNQKVVEFNTQYAGMGLFAFTPMSGETYTALLKDKDGNVNRYLLPSALNDGCVMAVTQADTGNVVVRLAATRSLANKEYGLVAQQNGCLRYASKLNFDGQSVNTHIPSNRFKTGIVQFTVLSAEGVPLAERLIFINHHDQLQVEVKTSKEQYSPHEKVELDLVVKNKAALPQQANLSVAVTDDNLIKVNDNNELGIEANLLMISDLRGYIETPGYYFNNTTPEKVKQLDNLLLTQGWRRFNWADIKSSITPALVYKVQKGIEVSGTIIDGANKPIPYGQVSLLAKTNQGPLLIDTIADKDGRFIIDQLDVDGDFTALVKPKSKKGSIKVILDKTYKPGYNSDKMGVEKADQQFLSNYLHITHEQIKPLNNNLVSRSRVLKDVLVKGKKTSKIRTIPGSFKSTTADADLVLTYDDLKWRQNLLLSMYGRAGIQVLENKVYRIRGPRSITSGRRPMEIRVNGSPVEPGFLEQLTPDNVEGVEIILSSYNLTVYGESGSAGVVEVTLRNSNSLSRFSNSTPITSEKQQMIHGYSVSREFYSPTYDAGNLKKDATDIRSTIYWSPNVVSDEKGKAKVSFFTADKPGTYRVVVEGINIDGQIARQIHRFTVR